MNILGSLMIWKTTDAVMRVPRSDRKQLRARRPDYRRAHRKMATTGWPRNVAIIRSSRRCAPRFKLEPAAYMFAGKLICHPAIYDQVVKQFNSK